MIERCRPSVKDGRARRNRTNDGHLGIMALSDGEIIKLADVDSSILSLGKWDKVMPGRA